MIKKDREKKKAIMLRKQGMTYSGILDMVPVAKSTLSIWLREVGLAKAQKQRLTLARKLASIRGGQAKQKQRIEKQNKIWQEAKSQISKISSKELFLIGVVLYWAEGTKEKSYRPGSRLQFSNMDPNMIQVFLVWLDKICKVPKNMIEFDIFLHESHKNRLLEVKEFWSKITCFPVSNFKNIYYKKEKIKTKRRNIGESYYGSLKINLRESSHLVRQITGWSEGIFEKITQK